jgi:hypothetical protein
MLTPALCSEQAWAGSILDPKRLSLPQGSQSERGAAGETEAAGEAEASVVKPVLHGPNSLQNGSNKQSLCWVYESGW